MIIYQQSYTLLIVAVLSLFTACANNDFQESPTDIPVPSVFITQAEVEPSSLPNTEELQNIEQAIPPFNKYNVTLDFIPEDRRILGTESVTYTNRTNNSLNELVFHINLNAWNGEHNPPPYTSDTFSRIFRHGRDYGFIEIHHVAQDSDEITFTARDTILTIFLPRPLDPDETTQINIQFEARIPKIAHHIGANDYAVWGGSLLPVEAVVGDDGWNIYPHYPIGTPFLLDVANFNVEITTPIGYTVAGAGTKTENTLDDRTVTSFTAQMKRDFAFAISDRFKRANAATASGKEIILYHYTEALPVEHILSVAVETMNFFEETVGAYPYDQIGIIETDMFKNGAGFTGTLFIDSNHLLGSSNLNELRHQIGRQWFSIIIGNNPVDEAWLSEGLTLLLQGGLLDNPDELRISVENSHRSLLERKHLIRSTDGLQIASKLSEYSNWDDYMRIQQAKAKIMFYALYIEIGDENFRELLREYYSQFAFKIASAEDFISIAESIYGSSLNDFFNYWLHTDELPDLPK